MFDSSSVLFAVVFVVVVLGVYLVFYFRETKKAKKAQKVPPFNTALQLQAYERLTILSERISLKNLMARIAPLQMDAVTYHGLLVESIKQEYEYNLSQQLYVSAEAWQAISNMKEQNIFILHQLLRTLPQGATGADLGKHIVELLEANPKASLHPIVLDALKYEARRVMQGT